MATKKATRRATSRPRLTVDISPALKRRIKVAAAAQDMPVSAYVAQALEQAVPAADSVNRASDGTITAGMIRRAAALRAEQKEPFPEDSADLIREAREQRDAEL
jgi:predicted transcriptional regulator